MADTSSVQGLDRYGKAIDDFPRSAMLRQVPIMLRVLRAEVGVLAMPRLFAETVRERRQVRRSHPEALRLLEPWGSTAVNQALMMVALFNVLARRSDREHASEVIHTIFTEVAPHSMVELYQLGDLLDCTGDPFDNFRQFHLAMFDASQHLFPNTQTGDANSFTTTVTRCSNVEVFSALDCPELATLGCDHDLNGYPAIDDAVHAVFRRPCTIAKGAETCRFRFYRRGTEPDTEEIDGETVVWVDSLNR